MDYYIVIQTTTPIFLLIGIGFLSRKIGVLKSGDQRVLSAYVYYFALPALFFINMVETVFTEETFRFMFAGIIPVFVVLTVYTLFYLIFRFSRNTLYLLILSTIFGSLSFFGIPFIMFAFPIQGENIATMASAAISPISIAISITVLELYRLEKSTMWNGLKHVVKRLSKNPLIVSILSGALLSLVGLKIPFPISTFLHMLGGTASTIALFMLGVFLYGRTYINKANALKLSLLRIIFLPVVALLTTMLFYLNDVERSTLVLMHGMPIAISMLVLSERYDFNKETIASLILISSLGAGIYLNLWLLFLGHLT